MGFAIYGVYKMACFGLNWEQRKGGRTMDQVKIGAFIA